MPTPAWLNNLWHFFTPPVTIADEEKSAMSRLLYFWTLIIIAVVLILSISFLLPQNISKPNPQRIPAAINLFGMLLVLPLLRTGRLILSVILHIVLSVILLLPSLLATGGIQAPSFSVLYVLLLFAGMFIGARSTYLTALCTSLFGLWLVWMQNQGYVVRAGQDPMEDWVAHTIYLLLVALMLNMTNRSVRDSLRRARRELRERIRTEEALRHANERLAFLHQVDYALLNVQSIEDVAVTVADRVRRLMDCDRVVVYRINVEDQAIHTLAVTGDILQTFSFEVLHELAEKGFFASQEFGPWNYKENLAQDSRLLMVDRELLAMGIRAYVGFPLHAEGKLLGMLNLAWPEPHKFAPELLETAREACDALSMAILQSDLQQKIKEHAANLEQHVSERTAQLQASNRELESFAYSISHDLRGPLRSMDGFSQALIEDYGHLLDSDGQDYLQRIRAGSQRMGQLIDDMLRLSRITRSEMHLGEVDLASMAREICSEFQSEQSDRVVECRLPDSLLVRADASLMRIMLTNLFSNAWKFTSHRENSLIEFGTQVENGRTVYFIRDNGVGFDMAYVDKLFNIFQRLHLQSEFEGTGIGLAIVQRIVRRHGGEIWVKAVMNRGATFFFTLAP